MIRVLVIEDDPDIALSIRYHLERQGGFSVSVAEDGERGLLAARDQRPDLVLLDLNLPRMDGLEVCAELRKDAATQNLPVIMLTARVEERDRVEGLDVGADDYITKPFSLRELAARVRAVLRRSTPSPDRARVLRSGPVELDEARRSVTIDGAEVSLTRKEFDLLAELMHRRGLVLSREKLLERVWGYEYPGETRTVDVHVRQLRKKLGESVADRIETVVGVGYRWKDTES